MIKKLAQKIQFHRRKKGYSLDKLADITGCSKSYLWELENPRSGKKNLKPSAEKLSDIAEALEVTIDFLADDSSEESYSERIAKKNHFYRELERLEAKDQERIFDMIKAWGKEKSSDRKGI